MNRKISYIIGTVIGTLPTIVVGITSYPVNPGFGSPSYSQAEYDTHYNEGYTKGKNEGLREASAECIADPKTCGKNYGLNPYGISLNSMLTGARYGETEPNENIISADPMVPSAIYWGQSMSYQDQDWFYVTTEEPNQIINLNFRPANNTGVNWGLTDALRGWDISVRDAAANVLAQFPFELKSQLNADGSIKEINIPTFVAFPGTYYVVVRTLAISNTATDIHWTPIPYNLISSISFSDSDTPPIDVNFFDVETEPNDDFSTADPVVSTVTMYGISHSTLAGNAQQGWNLQTNDEDWFWYASPGHEVIELAWGHREYLNYMEGYSWRVTVKHRDGTIVASVDTEDLRIHGCIIVEHLDTCLHDITDSHVDGQSETFNPTVFRTLYIGLEKAGDYFIQVMATLRKNADGEIVTSCREWSTPQPGQEAVCLSRAPVAANITYQYNFDWHATRLPPNTYDP